MTLTGSMTDNRQVFERYRLTYVSGSWRMLTDMTEESVKVASVNIRQGNVTDLNSL